MQSIKPPLLFFLYPVAVSILPSPASPKILDLKPKYAFPTWIKNFLSNVRYLRFLFSHARNFGETCSSCKTNLFVEIWTYAFNSFLPSFHKNLLSRRGKILTLLLSGEAFIIELSLSSCCPSDSERGGKSESWWEVWPEYGGWGHNLPFEFSLSCRLSSRLPMLPASFVILPQLSLATCVADNWLRTVTSDQTRTQRFVAFFLELVGTISLDRNDREVINLLFASPILFDLNILRTEKVWQFWNKKLSSARG